MLHHKIAQRDEHGNIVRWYGSSVDIDDRKRAELKIDEQQSEIRQILDLTPRRLEAQLRATLNVIPAYTWYAAPSGALMFVNERCADYLGLPKDHPLRFGIDTGAAWDSHILLVHPDDHEQSRRNWATCLRTGNAGEESFRARNAEGGYRWFLSRAEPLRAKDGTLLYWVGVNLEIDELKQAEFYLAEGQRLAHNGSWAFNAAGFNYWSPELFAIHGLDPGGKAPSIPEYMALVHPDDREFVAQEIHKMLETHRGFDFTKRIVRPDGTVRRVRCVGVPTTHGTAFQGFVGTGVDVTAQEELTDALRRSEAWLSEAQRLSHTGSWVLDLETSELKHWSPELLRICGFDPDEGIPSTEAVRERIHPEDRANYVEEVETVIRERSSVAGERRLVLPDGTIRHVQTVVSPVFDAAGRPIELIGTAMDVTERKCAEEALRESEERYRALRRGVAANGVGGTRRRIKHLLEPTVVRLHGAHAG